MFFSIIIPVFNVNQYLVQCIESVINQSYTNFELILINDGSTDGSDNICTTYSEKDKRIFYINKVNSGVSDTRNVGLHESNGEYVLFLDADDYWAIDVLYELESDIRRNNKPDFLFVNGEYREINNGNRYLYNHGFSSEEFDLMVGSETLIHILSKSNENLFSVWRGVYKNEIIKKHKIEFESGIKVGEDADWLFRYILNTNNCMLINNAFYVYRINRSGSAMSKPTKESINSFLIIVIKWIKEYYKNPTENYMLIASKLSDNFIQNFKYLNYFDQNFQRVIEEKVQKYNLLDFAHNTESIRVRNIVKYIGFNNTTMLLNLKWRTRLVVRNILLKRS